MSKLANETDLTGVRTSPSPLPELLRPQEKQGSNKESLKSNARSVSLKQGPNPSTMAAVADNLVGSSPSIKDSSHDPLLAPPLPESSKSFHDRPDASDSRKSTDLPVFHEIHEEHRENVDINENYVDVHPDREDSYPRQSEKLNPNHRKEDQSDAKRSAPLIDTVKSSSLASGPSILDINEEQTDCSSSDSPTNNTSRDGEGEDFVPDTSSAEESDEEVIIRRVKRTINIDENLSRPEKGVTSSKLEKDLVADAEGTVLEMAPPKLSQTRPSFPNRFILRDGNTPAFRYKLQNGKMFTVYQWDSFHMSPSRFLSENSLIVCADLMLRDHKMGPSQGFEIMDETLFLEELFRCKKPELSRFAFHISRWQAIFDSKVLFIPVFKSNHWSLLALAGCSDVLEVVWAKSFPGNSSPKKPAQLVAVHFDSLTSLGHRSNILNVGLLVEKGISILWKHKQISDKEDDWIQPDITAIVKSSLKVMHCDVAQQEDSVSCGWRTIHHMLHIATTGVKSPRALVQLAKQKLDLNFRTTMNLALCKAEKLSRPGTTDIPSLTYPLQAVVDSVKLSHFDAIPTDLREKAILMVRSGVDGTPESGKSNDGAVMARKNATKKAQSDSIMVVSRKVVSEMKERGLDKKQVMRKEINLSEKMSLEIAKYLFHYPPGLHYAECLYYTRYAYPDSFLVCIGVDVLYSPTPRIFGELISPSSARVKRSRAVHFQMDVFKSISRNATKYYDEAARFRLQEMVEHFRGVAEAILKSCAKQATVSDEVGLGMSSDKGRSRTRSGKDIQRKQEKSSTDRDGESGEEDETLAYKQGCGDDLLDLEADTKNPEDQTWDFGSSIVFQRPVGNELGNIRSSVSAREIAEDLDTCLTTADFVANEAIVSRIGHFEKYCRRSMQFQNRSVKVSSVKERVTGHSLATIPDTFSKTFVDMLKSEIRKLWSQELSSEIFQVALDELLHKTMSSANSLFRRNGQVFFGLSPTNVFLEDVPVKLAPKKKKATLEKNDRDSQLSEPENNGPYSTQRNPAEFVSFGLGFCTDITPKDEGGTSPDTELLALMFFVFQECYCQQSEDIVTHSVDENDRSSPRTFEDHCYEIRSKMNRALDELQLSEAQPWWEDGTDTVRYQIKNLKMKILRRICLKMTSRNVLVLSNSLFAYEVTRLNEAKRNTEQDIFLRIEHFPVQRPCSSWRFSCEKTRLPDIKVVSVEAEVLSTADVWNEVDFQVTGNQYLGVRRFDPVKLILSFNDYSKETTSNPLHGDYVHCFIAFVFNDPAAVGDSGPQKGSSPSDVERMRCVGPMRCQFDLILHDNLHPASGFPVSALSLVERWSSTKESGRSCYIVPVSSLNIRQEASQYFALSHIGVAPRIFRLAMVDMKMAESYEQERRKKHYLLMRHQISEDPFQRHRFRSLQSLEDDHKAMMRSLVTFFDKNLNEMQHLVIQKTLYGLPSDSSPNGSRVLENMTEDMKELLDKSGTVSMDDQAWWGSNLFVMDGFPGSGKSRTIAVLLCKLIHSLELPSSIYGYKGQPRAFVVTVSDSAMENIFCTVCNILRVSFGNSHKKYRQALKKMLCVSSHSVKDLVRSRQISYLTAQGVPESVIGEATIVFTTVSNLNREELGEEKPFSLLVVDEAEFVQDESLIEAVSAAFVRYRGQERFQRATILISRNRSCHDDSDSRPSKAGGNFFDRACRANDADLPMMRAPLVQQYRMSPALQKFLEPLILEADGSVGSNKKAYPATETMWDQDSFLKSLRDKKDHPLRSVMVIDTSLDKKDAHASSGSNGSSFNKWEASTIRHLLLNWAGNDLAESAAVQRRITVVCAYAKQRTEVYRQLTNTGLSKVQVRTVDQFMGVDNDIIILSLVDTSSRQDKNGSSVMELFPPSANSLEWIKLACTRARQALIVVGFGKHFCEQDLPWRKFFTRCLIEAQSVPNGTCGYYRPRFITGKRDFKLSTFSPSYVVF